MRYVRIKEMHCLSENKILFVNRGDSMVIGVSSDEREAEAWHLRAASRICLIVGFCSQMREKRALDIGRSHTSHHRRPRCDRKSRMYMEPYKYHEKQWQPGGRGETRKDHTQKGSPRKSGHGVRILVQPDRRANGSFRTIDFSRNPSAISLFE